MGLLGRHTVFWLGLVLGCSGASRSDDEPGGTAGSGEAASSAGFGNAGQGGDESWLALAGSGQSDAGLDCDREVRLMPVELGEPPPFDVIIVADHSQSLSWSRDDLAAGLSNLLHDMQGRDARFFVLTPTQYGASSAEAIDRFSGMPLVSFTDPATGQAFAPAMTEYSQTCADPDGLAIECPVFERGLPLDYSAEGIWSFVMPTAIAEITADMSETEIVEQETAITDAILALGGTGSPSEQPLCTLNRYVMQDPSALPEHAVFVVISDEDDATLPEDCAASYHFEIGATETPFGMSCTEGCSTYQYIVNVDTLVEALQFTCVPLDDLGMPYPERGVARMTWLNGTLAADCTGATEAMDCPSGALTWAQDVCGAGHVVEPCAATCQASQGSGCSLQTTDTSVDYCNSPFTHNGASYGSILEYCDATFGQKDWLDCRRQGYLPGTSRGGRSHVEPLVMGAGTEALIDHFAARARQHFGQGGFFVEVIGFDPTFECVLEQGQSHATQIKRLATSPADVFPICGDYSAALDRVRELASYFVDDELEVVLEADEVIESITVQQADGRERTLEAFRYTYDPPRSLLTLLPGALGPTDVGISVQVAKDCESDVE